MDMLRAMRERHSVRQYLDRPIEDRALESLRVEIAACNREGGLNIQLIAGEPETFGGLPARLMHFARVRNYFALVGPEGSALEERLGWYGERLVLTAQALGLNTCWVAASYSRSKCKASVETGEKLVCVIAVGYGATQGKPHKSRAFDAVCRWEGEARPGSGAAWKRHCSRPRRSTSSGSSLRFCRKAACWRSPPAGRRRGSTLALPNTISISPREVKTFAGRSGHSREQAAWRGASTVSHELLRDIAGRHGRARRLPGLVRAAEGATSAKEGQRIYAYIRPCAGGGPREGETRSRRRAAASV